MAFDKAKIVRAAEKYLAQGKTSAAIKEYRLIVENDPNDFTALNMLGDLYARNNKKTEAIECFFRIADNYRLQGFNLKAIAMYKKIDRLQPNDPAIANMLAGLYEMQGLVVDARAQYMTVADAFQRAGQTQKALEVIRKVADLEPQNTEIRLKLANGYLEEGLRLEASEAFAEAGEQFLAKKNYDRALDAFSRTISLSPRSRTALNGVLAAHTARGTADEAAEIIEKAVAGAPADVELLSMLAHAYVEAEDAANAERAVGLLVEVEHANFPRFLDVAQLYMKEDRSAEAVRIISSVCDRALSAGHSTAIIEILEEVLARNPEHLEGLSLLLKVSKWQCDDSKIRSTLERLFEAAEALGNAEVERSALSELVHLVPDVRYLDRLEQLGGPLPGAGRVSASQQGWGGDSLPTFESFAIEREGVSGHSDPAEEALVDGVAKFEWSPTGQTVDSSSSFADLNEPEQPSISFEFETNSADSYVEVEAVTANPKEGPQHDAVLNQELESVDFYIAQSYFDIARDTLEMLERQFGSHPAIDERKRVLSGTDAAPSEPSAAVSFDAAPESFEVAPESVEIGALDFAPTENDASPANSQQEGSFIFSIDAGAESSANGDPTPVTAQVVTGKPAPGLDPGLVAIFDEFKEAVEEDEPASSDGDFETHFNLGIAYKEMDLLDQAVEEFQQATSLSAPGDGTSRYLQCCNMLGHCFVQKGMPRLAVMWFKKGLEIPGLTEDEYQALRYDLGTAYEQMGELESAIDVFTEVYGISVSYRGVAEKLRELQAQRAVK